MKLEACGVCGLGREKRTFENMSFSSNSRSWGTARSRWKRAFSATLDMLAVPASTLQEDVRRVLGLVSCPLVWWCGFGEVVLVLVGHSVGQDLETF